MAKLLIVAIIFLAACQEKIVHDLTELDANKIFSRLHGAKIDSRKEKQPDGFWAISVPSAQVIMALQVIEDYRFFKKPQPEQYKSKLLSSEQEQKLIYENSLAEQLEATLQSLTGVLEVHAHLNINQEQGLWRKSKLNESDSSGSILMIVNNQFSLSAEEITQIVSGAAGIATDRINTVINYPQVLTPSMIDASLETNPKLPQTLRNNTFPIFKDYWSKLKDLTQSSWFDLLWGIVCLVITFKIYWVINSRLKVRKFKKRIAT